MGADHESFDKRLDVVTAAGLPDQAGNGVAVIVEEPGEI